MDLIDISDVEASLERFGERYLRRVFTSREIEACAHGTSARRLAACFAAKEAAVKAMSLRGEREPFDLRSIEVTFPRADEPEIALYGSAAEHARRQGIRQMSVSVAVSASHASAVVVAESGRSQQAIAAVER